MNFGGLLFGSAAALVAVSGARAADAVMAPEPEPVEYVRVCDAYGAGFFYIPGTETCLQISGHIFYQIGASSRSNVYDVFNYHGQGYDVGLERGWSKFIEARVNFDARTETDWGTLRSYIRLQASGKQSPNGDQSVGLDQAFIQLAGFRMGYTESAWNETPNGGASNLGSHSYTGLSYRYQQRALIQYSFGGNGFFGTLSLEDDSNANYMPDLVGVVGYGAGWGTIWAKAAYDESTEAFAASLGAQINVPNMSGSSLRVIGFYSDKTNNAYGIGFDDLSGGVANWSVLASYNHVFSEKFSASLGFQYFDSFNANANGWLTELELVYVPVQNFEVRASLSYAASEQPRLLDNSLYGFLRFTRYF